VKGRKLIGDPIATAAKRRERTTGRTRIGWVARAISLTLAGAAVPASGDVPESVTIPLKVVQIPGVGVKVGIEVSLGGGTPRMYTFDTGSSGFYAAYNSVWWPSFEKVGTGTIDQSYGSGLQLVAERVRTTVGIATDGGLIEVTADVGKVIKASGGSVKTWDEDVAAGIPPLYGMFFGDFGSGLRELNGLFAVLPQLPGNLSSGFAVQLGCGGGGPESKVVVGLTEAIRSRVTSWVKMEKDPNSPPYPNSNQPTYVQSLFTGNFSLAGEGTSYGFSTPAILDTGGGTTDIQQAPPVTVPAALLNAEMTRVLPGAQFRVTAPGTAPGNGFDMAFVTGDKPTIDEINVSLVGGDNPKPRVNLALIPFFKYDVVFDVARGNVGFAPCTAAGPITPAGPTAPIPTLSAWAMVLLAAGLALTVVVSALRRSRT